MKASIPPPNHTSAIALPSAFALDKTSPLDIDKNSTLAPVFSVNLSNNFTYLSLVATTFKVLPSNFLAPSVFSSVFVVSFDVVSFDLSFD